MNEQRPSNGDSELGPPSVLMRIKQKIGDTPRISLHGDSATASSPVIDPRSDERHALPQGRGTYQLMGEIARGGMGVVLKGHDTDLGRDVALKVLHKDLADDPGVLQRFVEEAQIGGQLQHPGIVPVYELGLMADERPYFTMKLVKGKTLAALFSARANPDEDRARLVDIFESMCQTMAYAHSRGVIHRDLKPSNVMVGAFGEVQVVDWGLAKVLTRGGNADEKRARRDHAERTVLDTVRSGEPRSGSSHSVAGSVMGTPAYMPPEQASGRVDKLDERSDVFSLGAILCEILTGLPPYPGDFDDAITSAANANVDDATSRLEASGAAPELIDLAKQCLMPSQLARPRNAEILAERVRKYIDSTEDRARRAEVSAAVQRRAKWLWSLIVAIVLLFGGGGVAYNEWNKAQELQRTFGIAADARDARFAATSLRDQARKTQDLASWNLAYASAVRAQAIATTNELEKKDEIDALAREIEEERDAFVADLDKRERVAAFTTAMDAIASSPSALMSGTAATLELAHTYEAAFDALGVDVLALPPSEAVERLEALGFGAASGTGVTIGGYLDGWSMVSNLDTFERLIPVADRIDPDPFRSQMRALLVSNDREAIRSVLASPQALHATPDSTLLLFRIFSRNQIFNMETILSATRANYPDDLRVNLLFGIFHVFSGGDLWEALPYMTACESIRPDSVATRIFRAGVLAALDREEQALQALDAALDVANASDGEERLGDPIATLARGFRIGRHAGALDRLEMLLRARIHEPAARVALVPLLRERQNYRGAVEIAREFTRSRTDAPPELWWELGMSLSMIGEHAEAIDSMREGARRADGNAFALADFSWALSTCPDTTLRNPEEAVAAAERACALAPDVPACMEPLGAALYRAGRFDEARDVLELTAQLALGGLRRPAAYFHAMALHSLGDATAAAQALTRADRIQVQFGNSSQDELWARLVDQLQAEAHALIEGE